jgi:hypothetical protein
MTSEQGKERRIQVRLAYIVSHHLGVKRANKALFPAIAHALGKEYGGGKNTGYALVSEYARVHGLCVGKAVKKKASAPAVQLPRVVADDFLLSYEWRKLRMVVLKRRGARCECCGATPADGKTVINVDHIKPRLKFPELALVESNLQVLCNPCNHGKGNWDETDWRAEVSAPESVDPMRPRLVRKPA